MSLRSSPQRGRIRRQDPHGEVLAHLDSDAGDALSSILGKYQQDGVHQSESVWLRSYTGESFTVSRKKEGTTCIREPCLTCCFMATPATVHGLFQIDRLSEGGLLGRFHVVNPHARAQEIPEDSANEVRRLPSDVAEAYDAAIWTFLREYRIKANEEQNNHVIGMTPGARLELIRYANSIIQRTDHLPDPFEARHGEGAVKFALIVHLFKHVEVEQRGETGGTYGIKPGSLVGHEIDLAINSARAGIKIEQWFARRQKEFLGPKQAQDKEAIWDKFCTRMRKRPCFTIKDLYAGQSLTASEASAFFSQWESNGWIQAIPSKKAPGPGRPPLQDYRLPQIFKRL